MVNCGIFVWCIVRFERCIYWPHPHIFRSIICTRYQFLWQSAMLDEASPFLPPKDQCKDNPLASLVSRVEITKLALVKSSVCYISAFVTVSLRSVKSHSYLSGLPAAKLRRHLYQTSWASCWTDKQQRPSVSAVLPVSHHRIFMKLTQDTHLMKCCAAIRSPDRIVFIYLFIYLFNHLFTNNKGWKSV